VRAVKATGYFSLNPAAGSYEQGTNFSVLVGANSAGEAVVGLDVVGSFDATKLELVSIAKVESSNVYQFVSYDQSLVKIDNGAGTFAVTLTPSGSSVYMGQAINEDFLRLTFKGKAIGVASVNFTCETGSVVDSNIINQNALDIVDCASNQSGSYTISGGSGTAATTAPTSAAATTTVATTTTTELPETGGIAGTVGMMVFGAVSLMGVLLLRWL